MDDPLPSPPFIDIQGIANFRGIGGPYVGPGLVYRSADPTRASRQGLEKMSKDLGIRKVFDLRSAPEIKRDGPEWAGVAVNSTDLFEPYGMVREWVPVFAEEDYGPDRIVMRYKEYTRTDTTEGFVKAYHDILLSGTGAYAKILRHLAQPKPSPCLVHCTAGKDRTGVIVALLYMLTGAPAEEIAREYSLTDLGLRELKPVFIERLLKNPALEGNEAGVHNMISSKPENMLATIKMIQSEFGGARKYMLKNCGLSEQEVDQVRKNVTDGALANI